MEAIVNELSGMARKDLQALAKDHGLKANQKSSLLIEELAEILLAQRGGAPAAAAAVGTPAVATSQVDEVVDAPAVSSARKSRGSSVGAASASAATSASSAPTKTPAKTPVSAQQQRPSSQRSRRSVAKTPEEEAHQYLSSTFETPFQNDREDAGEEEEDEKESSFQRKSFGNLTRNIATNGRISISTPMEVDNDSFCAPSRRAAAAQDEEQLMLAISDEEEEEEEEVEFKPQAQWKPRVSNAPANSRWSLGKPSATIVTFGETTTKAGVSTPKQATAATAAGFVPKSNKAQRLRREALARKQEKMNEVLKKNASDFLFVSHNAAKPAAPKEFLRAKSATRHRVLGTTTSGSTNNTATTATATATSSSRPAGAVVKARPVAVNKPQSKPAKPAMDVINVVVDNEVSFNIGSAVKPKQPLVLPKSNVKKVPDFNKMHSLQFSAQKSITQKVARDPTIVKKLDSAMEAALKQPTKQQQQVAAVAVAKKPSSSTTTTSVAPTTAAVVVVPSKEVSAAVANPFGAFISKFQNIASGAEQENDENCAATNTNANTTTATANNANTFAPPTKRANAASEVIAKNADRRKQQFVDSNKLKREALKNHRRFEE